MITLTLNIDKNLNTSLQVGDAIYAIGTETQPNADDSQASNGLGNFASVDTGSPQLVGRLRQIQADQGISINQYTLSVDDQAVASMGFNPYYPNPNDFIMFSKWDQSVGKVSGYYAKAKFINDSTEKAELFSVGSEVTINSK